MRYDLVVRVRDKWVGRRSVLEFEPVVRQNESPKRKIENIYNGNFQNRKLFVFPVERKDFRFTRCIESQGVLEQPIIQHPFEGGLGAFEGCARVIKGGALKLRYNGLR